MPTRSTKSGSDPTHHPSNVVVGSDVRTSASGELRGRRATIADVARVSATSPALVSRYLSGKQRVSETSGSRIREAINVLEYVPSVTAQNLRLRRTGLIALVVPYLDNPLYSLHATGAERKLAEAGFLTVVCSTRTKPGGTYLGRSFFDTLGAGRVDGALIFPYQEEVDDLLALRDRGTPVVLIDRVITTPPGARAFDAVVVDNEGAVYDATRRLLARGHTRIGLVSLRADSLSGAPRLTGYTNALRDAGHVFDPTLLALGDGSDLGGAALMGALLDRVGPKIDAVVVATTLMTRGALATIRRRQLRVPSDLDVIGYRHEQSVLWPEVATYQYPGALLGEVAAEVLVQRLASADLRVKPRRRSGTRDVDPTHGGREGPVGHDQPNDPREAGPILRTLALTFDSGAVSTKLGPT